MKIGELKKWLTKMEEEGAVDLEVEVDCEKNTVKLTAVEPTGIIAESIMLVS